MNELALFAGAGGGILGGTLLGWRTVCAIEIDAYCASVLAQRQNDKILPPFPIWDDVRTFDGRPWRGLVDVVSGGFPCQDISSAGKGAGINGERSGLWGEMARIIGEVRPRYAFVENSPALTLRGLDRVLGDLSQMGYDAEGGVVGAIHAGASHKRDRIWIVAHSGFKRLQGFKKPSCVAKEDSYQKTCNQVERICGLENFPATWGNPWLVEPELDRMVDGVAHWVDRTKAIGNGQVPAVAAKAWGLLTGGRS